MAVLKRMLFNLVYWSNAAKLFSDAELFDLLAKWREKNTRLAITGLLLYKEGAFIQSLEGEEVVVRSLYATIRNDVRHYQVMTLQANAIQKRQFSDWSMGFKNLHETDVATIPGYTPNPRLPAPEGELGAKLSVATQLLTIFAGDL